MVVDGQELGAVPVIQTGQDSVEAAEVMQAVDGVTQVPVVQVVQGATRVLQDGLYRNHMICENLYI